MTSAVANLEFTFSPNRCDTSIRREVALTNGCIFRGREG